MKYDRVDSFNYGQKSMFLDIIGTAEIVNLAHSNDRKEVVRVLYKNQERIDEVFIRNPPFMDRSSNKRFFIVFSCLLKLIQERSYN